MPSWWVLTLLGAIAGVVFVLVLAVALGRAARRGDEAARQAYQDCRERRREREGV